MNRFADTRDMSHSAWLEARRAGIGGSDAAAILGASPWATPLSVWADKQGLTAEKPDTIAMRFGRDAEEIVARWFAEDTGKTVARCNAILQHPEHPFMLANIDRQIRGERAGLECKAVERRKTELEQIIKLEMGSATEGSAGAYRVVYRPQERRSIDEKRLALEEPAIYARYVKTTCSRPLRITEVKACNQ